MRAVSLLLLALLAGCDSPAPHIYGTVERDRLTLTAPVGEQIATQPVREGDRVKAGQVLLTLDSRSARAEVDRRQAELAQAEARLAELLKGARSEALGRARAALAGAEAALREAELRYGRTERLLKTQVLTVADFDAARAARDGARASREQAAQSLNELENGTRSEQIDQARAAVAAAGAALTQARKALADLTLSAARDARVELLPWRVGDRVAAGSQLVGLLAEDAPYVRVYLPAPYLTRLAPGSRVQIRVDGRADPIPGLVRTIRSEPAFTPYYALNERDRARLMYLTDIDIEGGAELPAGLALEVILEEPTP